MKLTCANTTHLGDDSAVPHLCMAVLYSAVHSRLNHIRRICYASHRPVWHSAITYSSIILISRGSLPFFSISNSPNFIPASSIVLKPLNQRARFTFPEEMMLWLRRLAIAIAVTLHDWWRGLSNLHKIANPIFIALKTHIQFFVEVKKSGCLLPLQSSKMLKFISS